jgi:phospholipid N-methyltransferase
MIAIGKLVPIGDVPSRASLALANLAREEISDGRTLMQLPYSKQSANSINQYGGFS